MSRHLSENELALAETGDLPRWKQWLAKRHLSRCDRCAREADAYATFSADLRAWGRETPREQEPPWLAAHIMAAAAAAPRPAPLRGLQAAALLALVLVALWVVTLRAPLPQRSHYRTSATAEAVVGETAGPAGAERMVLYTGTHGGPVEISAAAGGVGVSSTDPATGAVIITRVTVRGME